MGNGLWGRCRVIHVLALARQVFRLGFLRGPRSRESHYGLPEIGDENEKTLNETYAGKEVVFLAVLNGAFMFASDLMKEVDLDCEISFVKMSSYRGTKTTGQVQELIGLNTDIRNKHVIIIEDIVDTGHTVDKINSLSQNKNFAGIILETPFTSMIDAAKKFYPYIPVGLLLKDKFENKNKIKNIKSPILIMHGEKDQIVPFEMGKKMFEIANEPKYSYFTKYDNHMMEYDESLVKALNSFLINLN